MSAEAPENDGRRDAKTAIGAGVVPNVMIVVEIRSFAVIARITAGNRHRRCRGAGGLVDRKERHIHRGRIRVRDGAGVQTSVRQHFARGHSIGISNVDGAAQNDAAGCKAVEIVIAVVFLRTHFHGK